MFFLIMQFLWKYIDDLIGKGLEITVLLKLLFYVSATLIPLALPLAVLFSSIMTYGNLAEHNELTALKSAGLSLLKIMRPMFVFVVFLSLGAFYFTNYMLPVANYKWRTIIYDIQEKKPTFGITAGVFYNDIENHSIRVDKKNDNTGELEGVLIYQFSPGTSGKTIKAKKGQMLKSENDRYLLLKLTSGTMYEKLAPSEVKDAKYPFQKSFFEEAIIKFDLSGFQMQKSNEDLFKRDFEMLNVVQLNESIDSLYGKYNSSLQDFSETLRKKYVLLNDDYKVDTSRRDSSGNRIIQDFKAVDTIIHIDKINQSELKVALTDAQNEIRSMKDMLHGQVTYKDAQKRVIDQFITALHKKFTLSVAILVLFFIGAPLGAIIKKGGLGTPLIFAVLFFLLYYILTIMGENMVASGFIVPWKGMWISTLILTPIGLFLTYKAANDSSLFDINAYVKFFKKIVGR